MIFIRNINLRRWFPPENDFAASVARMSILREDFAIEMRGVYEESIAQLDGNTEHYRRIYFWRNMLRTMLEFRGVLETLNASSEFRNALEKEPLETKNLFHTQFQEFKKQHDLLKTLRNDIGGHIQYATVKAALNGMPHDKFGFLEVGETLGTTHYRLAGEIILEMQLVGLGDDKRVPEIERRFRETAKLLPIFPLAELIFAIYEKCYNLV